MAKDYEYSASLNDSEVLKVLKDIRQEMQNLAGAGNSAFGEVQSGADSSAAKLGSIAGAAASLTTKLIELGAAAVSAFAEVIKGGVDLNRNLEQAEVTFASIFKSEEIGSAVLQNIKELSTQLGVSTDEAIGFSKSLVTDTSSVDQLNELLSVSATAAADAGVQLEDVRFAVEEFLSGSTTSLQDRLNLPKDTINRIKDLGEEIGPIPALIQGLGERFDKTGVNLDNFADTFDQRFGRVQSRLSDLQTVLGEPLFDVLSGQLERLEGFLEANEDDLVIIAQQIGEVVGRIAEFTGDAILDFIEGIDLEKVQNFLLSIQNLIEQGAVFVSTVFEWVGAVASFLDVINPVDDILQLLGVNVEGAGGAFDLISDALKTLTQLLAFSKAGFIGFNELVRESAEAIGLAGNAIKEGLSGNIAEAAQLLSEAGVAFGEAQQKAADAANASIAESAKALESADEAIEENKNKLDERRNATEADTSAQLKNADAILSKKDALEEENEFLEKIADAQEKFQQDTSDAASDYQEKLFDIQRKGEQKRLESEIDFAEKRAAQARKNAQAIEDINRKTQQKLADAARDNARALEDLNRKTEQAIADELRNQRRSQTELIQKQAEETAKIEQDQADERVEIEEGLVKKLEDIRRNFERKAGKAEQNRDAISFLDAFEESNFATEDATRERDDAISKLEEEGEKRREELAIQHEEERTLLEEQNQQKLEDLRIQAEREREEREIAAQRKLEDIALAQQRELDERRIANQREVDELRIAEEAKRAELKRAQEQQNEDAKIAYQRRLADLRKALEREIAEIKKAAAEAGKAIKKASSQKFSGGKGGGFGGKKGKIANYATFKKAFGKKGGGSGFLGIKKKAKGGPVSSGESYLVGEEGPELFEPSTGGNVVSNGDIKELIFFDKEGKASLTPPGGKHAPKSSSIPITGGPLELPFGDFRSGGIPPTTINNDFSKSGTVEMLDTQKIDSIVQSKIKMLLKEALD